MVHNNGQFQLLFIGNVCRDFIITNSGNTLNDIPGGSVLYAAANAAYWKKWNIGLVARAGLDFPEEWIRSIRRKGFDTSGIQRYSHFTDSRFFISYLNPDLPVFESPVLQYSKLGLEAPSALVGYSDSNIDKNDQYPQQMGSIGLSEVPQEYLNANAAHICPLNIDSQKAISQLLNISRVYTITLEPSDSFMEPSGLADVPLLVKGLSAFIVSERNLRNLFAGKTIDLWEMAEAIAGYGCEIVVIRLHDHGQYLYDHSSHARWGIPAYPAKIDNPRGVGNSFCGGFLSGFRTSYSPVDAALFGNISTSLSVEGDGPFFIMDAFPALGISRVEALRKMIKKF